MNSTALRGVYLRLAGVVMLVVVLALVAVALLSHRVFEDALAPEMSRKVAVVGTSTRGLILKAVEHGVSFRELYGIDQRFDELKVEIPEISSFAITDAEGNVLHQSAKPTREAAAWFKRPDVLAPLHQGAAQAAGAAQSARVGDQHIVSLPIVSPRGPLGMLHIGIDVRFVDAIVLDMTYDVLVVLVVALFFTLELLHYLAGERLERSLRALSDTIDRGVQGQFATPAKPGWVGAEFAPVARLLDAVLERVNRSYQALAADIDAARRLPAHERPPALAQAQMGLQRLATQFRFGREEAAVAAEDSQIGKVRAPLFVFILAEELTRSFLPAYVKDLLVPLPWLKPELLVGLPIALFMLIVALAQPYLGAYSERVGHRHAMRIGAVVAAAGFLASAFASTVLDLLIWRSACAVGYAMVFVAAQGYVLEHATPGAKARSFAVFIGAIMVATVCGPSIGGILADNIGTRPTFVVAAVLALASLWAMRGMPGPRAADPSRPSSRAPTLREIGALLVNRRFMAVTGLAAVPAKVVLTGICFYLVPLYLLSIGGTQAMTGRLLMCYAVVMVLMSPLTASLAGTRERMEWLVGGGLVVSGLGGVLLYVGGDTPWVLAAVLLIGLGQSLSMSAQSALVGEHCAREVQRMGESAVYGVYRLLERMGNAAGPLLAGALVVSHGYRAAFVVIGCAAVVCGALFLLSTGRSRQPALVPA